MKDYSVLDNMIRMVGDTIKQAFDKGYKHGYADGEKAYQKGLEDTKEFCGEIKDLPSVTPQQRWIPVSERLPEEDGLYLVSVKNDHQRRYSKTCYFSRKNWFAKQDVVAWMPLPKPYESQESEDKG